MCSTWLCSLSMRSILCFDRDSAADQLHPVDNYETVDTQRQREQPHYDVVALDHIATRPPNVPHLFHNYENDAIAEAATAAQ